MSCGGCAGLGAHTRWCPAVVGARAHRLGTTAALLEDCGDIVSDAALANRCWDLAALLHLAADDAAETHEAGQA